MSRKRQISIAFTKEQHEWLERRETDHGIPKAETVRRAISLQMLKDTEHQKALASRQTNTIVTI